MYYKLDENKNVVPCTAEEWRDFIENRSSDTFRHIANDNIKGKDISTVFMGIFHGFDPESKEPIFFETMVFNKKFHSIYQKRYSTWDQACEGHKRAVEWVKNGCKYDER